MDGTNGDTTLERIDASFLNTSLVAKAASTTSKGVKGRRVSLDITMDPARLEDVMKLAVKTPKAPMTGALRLKTKFELPPGDQDVVDKLRLDGRLRDRRRPVHRPGCAAQNQRHERAGDGQTGDAGEPAPKVASDFSGRFALGDGVLSLQRLTFNIPGAVVELKGQYVLQRETLAFLGHLFMDAKVSEATTGWKSVLLRMVDPLFRKNGQTVIPLKIGGTRSAPSFGMDVGGFSSRAKLTRLHMP